MSKTIYVLHERSTKEHFIALETYAEVNDVTIKYREFLIAKYVVKSIVRLDTSLFLQQIRNLLFFIGLLFSKRNNIIIGIAPLDTHLPILKIFLKGHHVFYFTSWGDWSGERFPKQKRLHSEKLRTSWRHFLEQRISGVFCVTELALHSLRDNYHIEASASVVGHSVNNLIPLEAEWNTRKTQEPITLIYVGRLVDTKGVYELIELMRKLDPKKYRLYIVGDGPLRKEVESISEKSSNIQYFGYVGDKKELFRLYSQSNAQLLFSKKSKSNHWEELFGMVIVEAMYCGLPTIATRHIGPKSIIENGVNGFLVNEETMIKETLKILQDDTFNTEEISDNAKNTAQQFYKGNLSKKWAQILDSYTN